MSVCEDIVSVCYTVFILPVSELIVMDETDSFSIEINSLCFATVTCTEPVQECTAYCGPSGDLADLTNTMNEKH